MKLPVRNFIIGMSFLIWQFNVYYLANAADREFVYKSGNKCDPFMPLVSTEGHIRPEAYGESVASDLDLEGIIWDPSEKSVAIINGKLLKEQDRAFNIQVLSIKKTSVIVQKEGNVIVLNLKTKGGEKEYE
ncbi:MAG: hypothetical protein HY810_09605 [Candidatus Omnitrophica bacterium]|nr:hypothetical protein [Candidatus Omnitrophota bacterium]